MGVKKRKEPREWFFSVILKLTRILRLINAIEEFLNLLINLIE